VKDIRADVVDEARRVTAAANESDIPVRLIGGLAIRLHAGNGLPPQLERQYQDIDLITTGKASRQTLKLLEDLGYTPHERFNALNAGRRAVVYDVEHQRQIDVFIDEFRMCHKIELNSRLTVDSHTIPLAELLLTKLQIIEINRKDILDVAAIVHQHEVGDHDDDTVNARQIAKLLAGDWGLWRTSQGTIKNVQAQLSQLGLQTADVALIEARLARIWARVDEEPKSVRWRARARIGERSKWYDEPEEIAHARPADRT
jgi:hypothetical protein